MTDSQDSNPKDLQNVPDFIIPEGHSSREFKADENFKKQKPTRKINPLFWVFILSGLAFMAFVVGSAISFFKGHSDFSGGSSASAVISKDGIGVIELNGVILDSKKMLKQIKKYGDNKAIKAVVMRINSPGGAVGPSQEIFQALKKLKKPVIASMSSVAASGGYYIACGAEKIYANPGTLTGSIGVIMEFMNLKKLYEWAKVERFAIKSGKFKAVGNEYSDMTADERQLLQTMVDDVLLQFKEAVMQARKLKPDELDPIADGRIMNGTQAKTYKLVDELGSLEDAIDYAAKKVGLGPDPKVYYPESARPKFLDLVMDRGGEDDDEARSSLDPMGSQAHGLAGILITRLAPVLGLSVSSQSNQDPVLSPGLYWLWRGEIGTR